MNILKKLMMFRLLLLALLSKKCFGTRIDEIEKGLHHKHVKYVTTQEFNQLTSEKFEVRLKQASLASKNNIGKTNLDKFKTNF